MTASTSGFDVLRSHAARLRDTGIAGLLESEPGRVQEQALQVGPLYANFARQRYDAQAWGALLALARERDIAGAFRRLFDGAKINVTEGRAVLHTALRGDLSPAPVAHEAFETAAAVRVRMRALIEALEASGVTDIVSVGIGGSDLGPRLVADALRGPLPGRFRVHFISNVDGAAAQRVLAPLDVAVSKVARFSAQDRQDIRELARVANFGIEVLRKRTGDALLNFIGNHTRIRKSLY